MKFKGEIGYKKDNQLIKIFEYEEYEEDSIPNGIEDLFKLNPGISVVTLEVSIANMYRTFKRKN